ncbi:MAG TPA: hypothetical protein VIP57_09055, partial [Candidatus Dormibacteraeota bacterium]
MDVSRGNKPERKPKARLERNRRRRRRTFNKKRLPRSEGDACARHGWSETGVEDAGYSMDVSRGANASEAMHEW